MSLQFHSKENLSHPNFPEIDSWFASNTKGNSYLLDTFTIREIFMIIHLTLFTNSYTSYGSVNRQ